MGAPPLTLREPEKDNTALLLANDIDNGVGPDIVGVVQPLEKGAVIFMDLRIINSSRRGGVGGFWWLAKKTMSSPVGLPGSFGPRDDIENNAVLSRAGLGVKLTEKNWSSGAVPKHLPVNNILVMLGAGPEV